MDNNQLWPVARSVEYPSKPDDMMPVGFEYIGRGVIDDKLAEGGGGRRWDYQDPQCVVKEEKNDGFVSILTHMVRILPEGKPMWGGPCQKVEGQGETHRCQRGEKNDPENPDAWEAEISKPGRGGALYSSTVAF